MTPVRRPQRLTRVALLLVLLALLGLVLAQISQEAREAYEEGLGAPSTLVPIEEILFLTTGDEQRALFRVYKFNDGDRICYIIEGNEDRDLSCS